MLAQTPPAQNAPAVTVHQVCVQDDEDHPVMNTPEAIAAFEQRHRERSWQVRELLAEGQITSAEQLYDSARNTKLMLTASLCLQAPNRR